MSEFIKKVREERADELNRKQLAEIDRNKWLSIIAIVISIFSLIVAIFK